MADIDDIETIKNDQANRNAEIESLRRQNAKYRVARNDALRAAHAYKTVVNAHNIKFALDEVDLTQMQIDNGAVVGDFAYTPPAIKTPSTNDSKSTTMGASGETLSLESVADMDANEINERWDEIKNLMLAKQ